MDTSKPSKELINMIKVLNFAISLADLESEKEFLILQFSKSLHNILIRRPDIDPLDFFLTIRFGLISQIEAETEIEIDELLDEMMIREIYNATKTLLDFCKAIFPMIQESGIGNPLSSDSVLHKVYDVIGGEVVPRVYSGTINNSSEVFGELAVFLYPYINEGLNQRFAQEDLPVAQGEIPGSAGKKSHLLNLIKSSLLKLSLPKVTITEYKN